MTNGSRVLFLGHEASRTGAPLLLLETIKWLVSNSSVQPTVLLKRGGELESAYRAAALTHCYEEECSRVNGRIYHQALRRLGLSSPWTPDLARRYPAGEYPVVYANTIDTCKLAMQLAGRDRRVVQHIHELSYTTDLYAVRETLKSSVACTHSYIAASGAVRRFLEAEIGVPPGKIEVIHEFPVAFGGNGEAGESRQSVRRRWGIADDAPIVGMCGLPSWRKGADLFVQVAMHAKRQMTTDACYFVWLGGSADGPREANHDVAQLGMQDRCRFLPAEPKPEAFFRAVDLFVLTSREDPFPVAMLEAAAAGLPIVCFAGAGGAVELVEHDAGIVVPYLDTPSMASACVSLLTDIGRRRELGENARAKVASRYTLAAQGPKILAAIEKAALPN